MATCYVCPPGDQTVPDLEFLDHLRLMHPDVWGEGPERWADGHIVVHDMALDPSDFTGGSDG